MRHLAFKAFALACAAGLPALPTFAIAKVKIVNADGPGEGFNDPTPLAPSGANKGKTIGQQRLIAFEHAAKFWGATLPDIGNMQIRVFANFNPLACTNAGVVLGSAGTVTIWSDCPQAPFANTWYHSALANKLSGTDLSEGPKVDPQDPVFADGRINSPALATLPAGAAGFGAPVVAPGVTGALDLANDGVGVTTDGCTTLPAASGPGRLILIDRGTCTFIAKAKNAQDAGYASVIIANNAGGPPPGLGGCDGTITIPVASITNTDGANLKTALAGGPVNVTLGTAAATAGADSSGNPLLFAPNPVQLGSSISHWDTSAYPNQLMEPAINCNLTHSVNVPQDLTMEQLRDVGW